MPCYSPLQGFFHYQADGSRTVKFSNTAARAFKIGVSPKLSPDHLSLPCGRCMGCRLERSRQWAMRIMHETKSHPVSCFITLTYDDKNLPADGSLDKRHFQLFMKRLRKKFKKIPIRFYHCGEYGDQLSRPHYHAILFGFDFADKKRRFLGSKDYVSDTLTTLWGKGYCVISDVTFESAAYVARYCTKKITGPDAHLHYKGKKPEYATMSLKPGIGRKFYDKFKKDLYPSDFMIVRGAKCKVPRFYDRILEKDDPELLLKLKDRRMMNADKFAKDTTYQRLKVREKCQQARTRVLTRKYESCL